MQDVEFNPIFLEKVKSSFNRMKKTDQEDYLKLHNNFDNIRSLPPQKYSLLKTELEMRRLALNFIEENKEKAEEMIKIFDIYGIVYFVFIQTFQLRLLRNFEIIVCNISQRIFLFTNVCSFLVDFLRG